MGKIICNRMKDDETPGNIYYSSSIVSTDAA